MQAKLDVGAKKSKFSEDVNLVNKNEDSAKVRRLFEGLEVIRYTSILDTPSDTHSWSRNVHEEAKGMKPIFDVEATKYNFTETN